MCIKYAPKFVYQPGSDWEAYSTRSSGSLPGLRGRTRTGEDRNRRNGKEWKGESGRRGREGKWKDEIMRTRLGNRFEAM